MVAMDGYRRIIPLTLVLVLAGCGSGALSGRANTAGGPTPPTTTTTNTTQQTQPPERTTTTTPPQKKTTVVTTKRQYGWNLPQGPSSPQNPENEIYYLLVAKACDTAQVALDENWNSLRSPRNVPLYQAAIDLCEGRTVSARSMFAKAVALGLQTHQGTDGTAEVDCATIRAVRSVLDQVAQESVRCTPGAVPQWLVDEPSERDDPRTDVIEGTTTTSPTTRTSSS
ncbi:hypothetical protein [Lentzea terrae]|uniref:hypothetical protein n=1 Tax=Lentzea terrae TaxID=2200761 RepID=UPI0018E561BD|nr:hypothetical protein [Lentzea terrae]